MSLKSRIATLLNIQPRERPLVRLLMVFSFFLGLTYVFVQVPALALFLDTFGSSGLPYLYITIALISSVVTLLYLKLGEFVSYTRLLAINMGLIASGTLGIWYVLRISDAGWTRFILPVWFEMVTMLGGIAYFTLLNRLFDVRQGRRLIGVVRMTMWAANIGGGLITPLVVDLVGTVHLFILGTISAVLGLGLLLRVLRHYRSRLKEISDAYETGQPLRTKGLSWNRYILSVFALTFAWWITFYFVDNIFFIRLGTHYPNADQITAFLGVFYGIIQGTVLVIGNALTGTIINRVGIQNAALVMPFMVTICMIVLNTLQAFSTPPVTLFVLAAAAKLLNGGLGFSIDLNARLLLYQPLPRRVRVQIQTIGQGVVEPLSKGIGGAILLYLTMRLGFSARELAVIFLPIAVVWIFIVVATFSEYPKAIQRAISNRHIGLHNLDGIDETSIDVLQQGLKSPYPEAVIYSLGLLEQIKPDMAVSTLLTLLEHPVVAVRQYALERIEAQQIAPAAEAVRRRIHLDSSPHVRESALMTWAAIAQGAERSAALDEITSYLAHDDLHIRRGAFVALLRSMGSRVAEEALIQAARSPHPEDRRFAAQVMGKTRARRLHTLLQPLLADRNLDVQRDAIAAAGTLGHPRLWYEVIRALNHPRLRAGAAQALIAGGELALPEIRTAFNHPDQSTEVRIRLARLCGRIQSSRAITFLCDHIDFADAKVRTQILTALSACGYAAGTVSDQKAIQQSIRREVEQAVQLIIMQADLGTGEAVSLLVDALKSQLHESLERVLLLLSFLYDSRAMLAARDALLYGDATHRGYALEMLETTLSQDMKALVIPLYDDLPTLQRLHTIFPQQNRSRAQRLQQMIVGLGVEEDTWIRASALYAAARLHETACAGLAAAAVHDPHPLIRETALGALATLDYPAYKHVISQLGMVMQYSTIEKVMILKTISIFAETPADVLSDIAALLDVVEVSAGQTIIRKGDIGNSMYVIVSGRVRVHDGDHTLNTLADRDVFGEMALLDPEPRSASVTALEETVLFRLEQEPFYELIADRGEVARGIMRVLVRHLRRSNRDLAELRSRLQTTNE